MLTMRRAKPPLLNDTYKIKSFIYCKGTEWDNNIQNEKLGYLDKINLTRVTGTTEFHRNLFILLRE